MNKKKIGYYQRQFKIAREAWAKYSPERKKCFNNAKLKIENNVDKWRCAKCLNLFALSEVQCDHIVPISKTIPTSVEEYIQLFLKLDSDKLQILCKKHHNDKTKSEIHERNKQACAEIICKFFPSITPLFSKLMEEESSVLKRISNIITKFNTDTADAKNRFSYSRELQNFVERYNYNDIK